MLGVAEAHREDHQVGWPFLLGTRQLREAAVGADGDVDRSYGLDVVVLVRDELAREDRVGARILPKCSSAASSCP